MNKAILLGPTPVACRVGNAFVPVIFHPDRGPEPHPRKAKSTPDEAIAYAARVIWYRQHRENEKRRRLEGLSHPRFLTWGEYQAAPPREQRASWDEVFKEWRRNSEAQLDADFQYDRDAARTNWEWCL